MSDSGLHNNKLLELLDDDPVNAEEKYLLLLRQLTGWFRSRNCHIPEDLASETLFRANVAVNRPSFVLTSTISAFIFGGIASNVLNEYRRDSFNIVLSSDVIEQGNEPTTVNIETLRQELNEKESLDRCLTICIERLSTEERDLIKGFSFPKEGEMLYEARKKLADVLGITSDILKKRAFRIRGKLKTCIKKCLEDAGRNQ